MNLRDTRRRLCVKFESLEQRRVLSGTTSSHLQGPEDLCPEFEHESEQHSGFDDDSPEDIFEHGWHDEAEIHDPTGQSMELEAHLLGESLARGRVKFEVELEHGAEKRELDVTVKDAEPGSALDVLVNGIFVGQVQVDTKGEGQLELSSHPDDDQLPLPDDFPDIQPGSTVAVGDSLTGTFALEDTADDSSSDDSMDDSSDDLIDDSSDDSTDDSSDDLMDDAVRGHFRGGPGRASSDEAGRVKFERESQDGLEKMPNSRSTWRACRSTPNTMLTVDGVVVGQLTVNDLGMGELELKSDPEKADDLPFPEDFPTINSGSVVTVGSLLSGSLVQQVIQQVDINGDDVLDAKDIDDLFAAVRENRPEDRLDLNHDQHVNHDDADFLIEAVLQSTTGDANLDGVFDSSDLVQIFAHGRYEDHTGDDAGWSGGDWNGDGVFDSADLVMAFQKGHYRHG